MVEGKTPMKVIVHVRCATLLFLEALLGVWAKSVVAVFSRQGGNVAAERWVYVRQVRTEDLWWQIKYCTGTLRVGFA